MSTVPARCHCLSCAMPYLFRVYASQRRESCSVHWTPLAVCRWPSAVQFHRCTCLYWHCRWCYRFDNVRLQRCIAAATDTVEKTQGRKPRRKGFKGALLQPLSASHGISGRFTVQLHNLLSLYPWAVARVWMAAAASPRGLGLGKATL